MHLRSTLAVYLTFLVLLSGTTFAQQNAQDNKKAVVSFDIQIDRLIQSEFGKSVQMDSILSEMLKSEGLPGTQDAMGFTRVTGAFGLPNSINDFNEVLFNGNDLPINFFVELKFGNEDAADQIFNLMWADEENKLVMGGKSYYPMPEFDGPQNVLLLRESPTNIVVGTKDFLIRNNKNVFTTKLGEMWKVAGDAPVRIVADMATPNSFIKSVMDELRGQTPPAFAPMIDVIDNAESLKFSVDLDSEEMISLRAIGIDEENAKELRGVLDGLLGMAKMGVASEVNSLKRQAPIAADAIQTVMDELVAKGEGRNVDIVIRKPERMNELIAETTAAMRASAKRVEKLNRFRQVSLAFHNFADAYRRFPFDPEANEQVDESLSWRVLLLPFLEQGNLHDQFKFSEAWDSETNKQLVDKMPDLYGSAESKSDVAFVRPENIPNGFGEITDGTSGTIMLVENPAGQTWSQRDDLSIDQVVELFGSLEEGEKLVVGFYDGSVRYLNAGIDEDFLRKLLDPADGSPIDWEMLDQNSGR